MTGPQPSITLRPVEDGDEALLLRLYATTRADEMALVPWTDEEKQAFVEMQFEAQRTDYRRRFPDSTHSIILVDGEPAGRMWVERGEDEIHLLDITLLPEARNAGTGTVLLRRLQEEGAAAAKRLRHSVFRPNVGALRFYERLGFEVVEDLQVYLIMEWAPPTPA